YPGPREPGGRILDRPRADLNVPAVDRPRRRRIVMLDARAAEPAVGWAGLRGGFPVDFPPDRSDLDLQVHSRPIQPRPGCWRVDAVSARPAYIPRSKCQHRTGGD